MFVLWRDREIREDSGDHLNLIFPFYLKLMTGFPSIQPEDAGRIFSNDRVSVIEEWTALKGETSVLSERVQGRWVKDLGPRYWRNDHWGLAVWSVASPAGPYGIRNLLE